MFTRTNRRRSLLAMAGATAGVAAIVVGPTAANAQAAGAEDSPDTWLPVGEAEPAELAPQSHGTCFSWTTVQVQSGTIRATVNVPTTARNNNQRHCTLRRGNNTDGVFKLQDAINRCYPQFSSGVGFDGSYGANTERAVRQIQQLEGVGADGIYGPDTKTAMNWPGYTSGGTFAGCRLLRA